MVARGEAYVTPGGLAPAQRSREARPPKLRRAKGGVESLKCDGMLQRLRKHVLRKCVKCFEGILNGGSARGVASVGKYHARAAWRWW